jgi:hypothetical protein
MVDAEDFSKLWIMGRGETGFAAELSPAVL